MNPKNITIGGTEAFSIQEALDFYSKKMSKEHIVTDFSTEIIQNFDSLTGGIPKIGLTIIDGYKYTEDFLQTLFFKFVARKELNCVYFSLRQKIADLWLIKKINQESSEIIEKFKTLNPIFVEGSLIYDNGDIEELFDQPGYEGTDVIFLDSLNNIYNPGDKEDNIFDFIELITKINNLAKQNNMSIIAILHRKEKKNPLFRSAIKDLLKEEEDAYEMLMFLQGFRSGYIGTVYRIKATKPKLHYYADCMFVGDNTVHDKNIEFDEFMDIDTAINLSWKKNWSRYEKWEIYKEIYKKIHL